MTDQMDFSLRLEQEITRQCPECGADVLLSVGTMDGEVVDCPDCGFE